MRGLRIIAACIAAAPVAGLGEARAFQEMPPPPDERPAAGPAAPPGIALDFGGPPASGAAGGEKKREGFMPKLDFGLDLLYTEEQPATEPLAPADDLGVMGTVKRRF
jgi:hypothetical protein